jgi:hypothetical protein
MPANAYAGVLASLTTTAKAASQRCDTCTDKALMYVQGALQTGTVRIPFREKVPSETGLLEPDNTLMINMAAWLNTTEKPIHIETTLLVVYQFELAEVASVSPKVRL